MNEFPLVVIFLHYLTPFFFPPLLFSLLNPSHPPSFRPIRHTLIFGVLPPHSPPIFIYNRVTFILLLSSLQSSSITSSIPPFSVAFSSRHIYHTSALIFLPLLSSLVAFFKVCFLFYFLPFPLYCLIPIKHLTYVMWYDPCVCWREAPIWWKKVQIKHFSHSVKKWERKGAGGRKRA